MWRLVIVGGVLAFLLRGLSRLVHPQFYAEDGTVFLAGAYNDGLSAVFQPYNGYLHLIPRLLAALWVHVSLAVDPYLYALSAVTVYLLSSALVLSERVSWLIPSKGGRSVAFMLLCLLPPLQEVYGNIANLVAVCGLALFLLSMSDDPRTLGGRAAEVCVLAILALTGPFSILVFPLFVYRWFRNHKSSHSLAAGAVVVASASVQAMCVLGSARERAPGNAPVVFAQAIVERFAGGWLSGRVDPIRPSSEIVCVLILIWLGCAISVSIAGLRGAGLAMWAVICLLLASATWAYGTPFVLTDEWGRRAQYLLVGGWGQRALLVPTAVLAVALIATLTRSRSVTLRILASICLIAGSASFFGLFAVRNYPHVTNMNALEECLSRSAGDCVVAGYPAGWTLTLHPRS